MARQTLKQLWEMAEAAHVVAKTELVANPTRATIKAESVAHAAAWAAYERAGMPGQAYDSLKSRLGR